MMILITSDICSSSSRTLQEKLAETMDQLQRHAQMHTTAIQDDEPEHDRINHEQMHRTIDELIEQAAVKTRSAVREIHSQSANLHSFIILRSKMYAFNTTRI